jgi:aspartyl-tRNA synthetase
MHTDPGAVRANAYDMVINGVEVGGGSIRIFDRGLQSRMFDLLGFTKEEAQSQFGFLMNAFEYGAPPHGGIALGFDRLCSLFGGSESIRDYIAFPKNNSGRDVMIDAPSEIDAKQRKELVQDRHNMWAKDVEPNNDCYNASGECCAGGHVFCTTNHWMLFRVKYINGGF